MPYRTLAELPGPLKANLPESAQRIFMAAYNSAAKEHPGEDDTNAKIAWAAVKGKFRRDDSGEWVAKADYKSRLIDWIKQYVPKDLLAQFQREARAHAGGSAYKPTRERAALAAITPEKLHSLSDDHLASVHNRVGTLMDVVTEDDAETLRDFAVLVEQELAARGMAEKGGFGSGNYGHAGRPGEVGGSMPGGMGGIGGDSGNDDGIPDAAPAGSEFIEYGRRGKAPQPGKAYYHVASSEYTAGDDLLSFEKVSQVTGSEPNWKWEGDPFDTDIVSLHDNVAEARQFQHAHGGKLLRVAMPKDMREAGLRGGVNSEGYPYIENQIPAEYITEMPSLMGKDVAFIAKDAKQQKAYGIVYEPYTVDSQGDWATPEEIEKACHQYMEAYRKTGLRHDGKARDDIIILENYIAPQDMRIGDQAVAKGAWVMAVGVKDKSAWADVESGALTGLSLFGKAHRTAGEPPVEKGGFGSGNYGHAGRPGEVGGSMPGGGMGGIGGGPIESVRRWVSQDGKEVRVYARSVDAREGTKYITGNRFQPKGTVEGGLTSEEWNEVKRVAFDAETKRYKTVYNERPKETPMSRDEAARILGVRYPDAPKSKIARLTEERQAAQRRVNPSRDLEEDARTDIEADRAYRRMQEANARSASRGEYDVE